MFIVTILVLSVFGAGSALAADEGYIISKNSDYSTSDLEFVQTSDTIYMKIWSNVVGNNPKTKKWDIVDSQSIKKSGELSSDDTTPGGTRTFVASSSASNYATGDATLTMKLQSGKNKYIVKKTITITGAGNQPPPEPSWINPDNTDDNTPRITWQTVSDPNGDTVYYSIKIGTTSGGTDVLQETTTGTNAYYDVISPLDDDTYYVNVRANDGALYSNWHEETMVVDTSGPQPSPELKITSAYVNDNSNSECYNALASDGGTIYSLSKGAHIDAPFQIISDVLTVNSATLYYDSWGSLSGSWGIYLKDSRDGNTICSADPAPEDSSETRNSINCNSLTPAQLENGIWLFIKNNDNKKAEKINLDYVYLDVDYTLPEPITEMWVDDDYAPASCEGHTWGVDAFNRTQAAIYASDEINLTTINILPGNYSEIITIDRPVKLQGEISGEGDYLSNLTNIPGDKWALICVSANDMGDSDQSPDRDCFPAQGLQAYYALKSKGYNDDHIIFMLWHDDEQAYINQNDDVICEDNPNTSSTIENDGDDIDEWININYFTNGNWKNELYGPDGTKDTSDDPVIDVDNKAVTKAALKQQITQLSNQVTPEDEVLLYIVNHGRKYGTPERCQVYFEDDSAGTAGKYLDAATLDSWLDQVICKRMTILLDMCRTQNFVESNPGFTQEANRLIIGASGDIDNIAHAWYQARYNHPTDGSHFAGSWFFNPFWERIAAADTVQQAYQYAMEASDQMAEDHPYPYQYPFLFDKLRDVGSYSLVPYDGNVITFMTGVQDGAEVSNLNISAGSSGTGIKIKNKYVDFTQAIVNDNSQGYTDVTNNANSDDDQYFNLFPSTQALGDSVMIGSVNIFTRIYIELSTSGSSDGSFVVECAINRDEWIKATLLTDSTNYLTNSGEIIFKPPQKWAYQCHIHPTSDEKSEYTYWVRLRLIDTYISIPIGDYIDLSYFSEGARNITNNSIIDNGYGIHLKGISTQISGRGPIMDCFISGNDLIINDYAIYLDTCENILIYHNNFMDNTATNQVFDSNPGLNDWIHVVFLEGNYWSDYSGSDTNSDGIGDTNIPHPMANYDYYPFIHKDGWES
jgi:hypothetical protein